ncbi:MAG TPA: ABC transporter permease [Thermoanaerobaculia bacterium]|nr:ABC transporter permease [Thermoanaerobaculia bacterium]
MSPLLQDLRYAVRVLARKPGFTIVSLLTLGLAIGANTAIFSVVNALMLRPLPFPDPGGIVQIERGYPGGSATAVAIPKFVFWRDHNTVFDHVAIYDTIGSGFNVGGDGTPERITGSRVSLDFFKVFAVRPEAGREFVPEEDLPHGPKVVVLSHALWKRRFGGDRSLIGKPVILNGEPYTVVGIMPDWFRYPVRAELWTPVGIDPASRERANYLEISARLKRGVTIQRAQAQMNILAQQYRKAWPDEMDQQERVPLETLQERLYGSLRPALLILLGTVGLVLLIACVNLANLQLARAAARRREIALRTALGASSLRIVAQLLTESLLLALAGGALGVLLGAWTLEPLLALAPASQGPQLFGSSLPEVGIDGTVLLFAFALSIASGLLFGLAPALQAARPNLNDPLKQDSTRSTGGRAGRIARIALVIGEVAVALLVVTGAALLARSFSGIVTTDPGFKPEGVLTLKLSLPEARYGTPLALDQLCRQVRERVAALPGVRSAAIATTLPLEPGPDMPFAIEGKYTGGDEGVGDAQYRAATAGYFETLGLRLAQGRFLNESDRAGSEPVALINEAAVRQYWPTGGALGARITIGKPYVPELADAQPRRIVGIVKDVREVGLDQDVPPIIYIPIGQLNPPIAALFVRLLPAALVVRTDRSSSDLLESIQREIWAVDPQQPVTDVATMEEIEARSVGNHRFNMVLMCALAFLALVLAGVGIYGVLSYLVTQRTREIGVRMALGATAGQVLGLIVRQGLVAVGIGVAIGLGLVLAGTRVLKSLLVGVSVTDPLTFVVAAVVLTAVAVVASSIPAHRASALDPLVALRRE